MNTYKHSGGIGDMILGLPVVIALGGGTYYLYEQQAKVLGKLWEIQPYMKTEIISFEDWKTFEVTHNLDRFREAEDDSVARMHLKAFNVDIDLKKPWLLNVEPVHVNKIVICDTGQIRYPGYTVNWDLLHGKEKDCVFIGYNNEHRDFVRDRKIDIPYYPTETFYAAAQVIQGGNLFIGNQSGVYALAEGLKKPRVVDLYVGKPQYPFGGFTDAFVGLDPVVFYWCVPGYKSPYRNFKE